MRNRFRRLRRLPLILSMAAITASGALLAAGPALATHPHPVSATTLSVDLVEVAKQCGSSVANPANGQHSPPLSLASCVPGRVQDANGLHFGATGSGHAQAQVASPASPCPGNITGSDVCLSFQVNDLETAANLPYDPSPGSVGYDLGGIATVRIWDHYNCTPAPCFGPFNQTGTTTDVDFGPIPADCELGNCSVSTSANSVVPGSVVSGKETNIQVYRIRILDPGASAPGNLVLQQGLFVP